MKQTKLIMNELFQSIQLQKQLETHFITITNADSKLLMKEKICSWTA